jgi:plastocyanin
MFYQKHNLVAIFALVVTACSSSPEPLELTLTATDIEYDTSNISAKVSQNVSINFVNDGVLEHNFIIDEFGIDNLLQSGDNVAISFTPEQPGTYEFYCNVAGHLEAGMKGTITVTE